MKLHYVYCLVAILFLSSVIALSLYTPSQDPISQTFLPTRSSIDQVHITLGGQPHSINIAWVLKLQADICYISFGTYNLYSPDMSKLTYKSDSGLVYLSYVYNLTAVNLEPGRVYKYQVVCYIEGLPNVSENYKFTGPKRPQSAISFISLADWSTGAKSDPFDNYTTHAKPNIYPFLYHDVRANSYDALIHAGDFAYDLSSFGGQMGDDYMRSIEPIVAQLPYMTTTGNHESYTNFTHYRGIMKTPGPELYYSFDLGQVHFVMLDSEAYVGRFHTEEQLRKHQKWVEEDLDRNKLPWVVVVAHRPIYCSPNPTCKVCTNSCTKYCQTMAHYLESLMNQHQVALYISADVHLYERTQPLFHNSSVQAGSTVYVNPPAPIYIVNGVAGNFDRDDSMTTQADKPQPWSVKLSASLGYARVTVFNETHLRWVQVAVGNTQNDDMEWLVRQKVRVIDEFWVIRER